MSATEGALQAWVRGNPVYFRKLPDIGLGTILQELQTTSLFVHANMSSACDVCRDVMFAKTFRDFSIHAPILASSAHHCPYCSIFWQGLLHFHAADLEGAEPTKEVTVIFKHYIDEPDSERCRLMSVDIEATSGLREGSYCYSFLVDFRTSQDAWIQSICSLVDTRQHHHLQSSFRRRAKPCRTTQMTHNICWQ